MEYHIAELYAILFEHLPSTTTPRIKLLKTRSEVSYIVEYEFYQEYDTR
jgi:hypothetical protein